MSAIDRIYPCAAEIQRAMAEGSVSSVDAGVLTPTRLAATSEERRAVLLPYLLNHLRTCRPKGVPQHAEKIVAAVTPANGEPFVAALEARTKQVSQPQVARLKKVSRQVQAP